MKAEFLIGGVWRYDHDGDGMLSNYLFLHKIDAESGQTEIIFNRKVNRRQTYYCADHFTIYTSQYDYIIAGRSDTEA